jgi:nucleotide-binding universal stress UspA family protein
MNPDIKRIIVPVDFSPPSLAAARFACGLATKLGAHVYLIHVVPTPPLVTRRVDAATASPHRELAGAELAKLRQQLGTRQITTEVRTGDVDDAITDAVIAYGVDLIVMATHGRSGVPHLLFGSVAEQVIRTAPCPVLVMRDSGKIRVHHTVMEVKEERLAQMV